MSASPLPHKTEAPTEASTATARDRTLAHDLNQPLTALALYLQAMGMVADRQPQALAPEIRALLDKALAEAERARAIVERMRGAAAASPSDLQGMERPGRQRIGKHPPK